MLSGQRFRHCVEKENLFDSKDKLLLAVSGGIDSVVLCELCHQAGYDFIIAHCNFQLRGAESERDEQFVLCLEKKYDKQVLVKRFETEQYASSHKLSIQEAARNLRYEWFDQLTNKDRLAKYTITAHHADDNIETLLMHFFRGTGLHGLTGIPATTAHTNVVRPLLFFRKEEIKNFAGENNLSYVEDSSNASVKYTRNFFRHDIIPLIEKVYPQVTSNLLDNIERFKSIESVYRYGIAEIKRKLYKVKGKETFIPIKLFLALQNRATWYEIIRDFGFAERQVDEVIKLCNSESGSYLLSPTQSFRLIKHRNWIIAAPRQDENAAHIAIDVFDKMIPFTGGKLSLEIKPVGHFKINTASTVACLDHKHIVFPLLLRKWKEGDYFYPLGMKKKKKVARFLIDQKLSKLVKERVWVVEMNKKIIWVVGYRIDERFKVTSSTREVLQLVVE